MSVVNNMKEARDEHGVAVETEQRLNKSTIGRTEAAEPECGEIVCCSAEMPQLCFCPSCQLLYCMCLELCFDTSIVFR